MTGSLIGSCINTEAPSLNGFMRKENDYFHFGIIFVALVYTERATVAADSTVAKSNPTG